MNNPPSAAIRYEPDGYDLTLDRLMGRQSAGNAFLRAAVAGRGQAPLFAYTPHRRSAEHFSQLVRAMDPSASGRWLPAGRLDLLAREGALYLPGPGLGDEARLRLRAGCAAYSLLGVTHTTASHTAMDAITGLLTAPVMPWDALICTSQATADTVEILLQEEARYLRWRLGSSQQLPLPQLPVIPLGVHCRDFDFGSEEQASARAELGLEQDEVAVLFVGRLSFHSKAHPYPMYAALQAAAAASGRKLTLVQCGWFANDFIGQAFREGAAGFSPDVRALFADGKDPQAVRRAYAAADIFISLSDNIQETFGITPLEAMAAGLPVVVSDWDGYKDTVRDGIDGFRIPTRAPGPGSGQDMAKAYECGEITYDVYVGRASQVVSVDMQALTQRLTDLALSPSLRSGLGQAGRGRVRQDFDWAVVYRRYQDLYRWLGQLRARALKDPDMQARLAGAPHCSPARMDPFACFSHYPTSLVEPHTRLELAPNAGLEQYRTLQEHALFRFFASQMPGLQPMQEVFARLKAGPASIGDLALACGVPLAAMLPAAAALLKMGLVRPDAAAASEMARTA